MPALFVDNSAARTEYSKNLVVEAETLGADSTSTLCEILVAGHVLTGIYNPTRRHLTVNCSASTKLSDQPEDVNALVCSTRSAAGVTEFIALLAAEEGAIIVLPREGASNASEIRLRPRPVKSNLSCAANNSVAIARGPDPFTALLDAIRLLADRTGAQPKGLHAYALPLLDAANRLKLDTSLMPKKTSEKRSSSASLKAALEQQLHEGILVQAGPGCPAKPLLQAPGLRICQGMVAPLGLRYAGMSVVYGAATGHILAVMDTAAALKMAPVGVLHPLGSSSASSFGDAGSPSAVSAGASAATSATPSPSLSRSNSSTGDAALAADAMASLALTPPPTGAAPVMARSPPVVLSGRSITAAPIIHVLAAAPPPAASPSHESVRAPGDTDVAATPTGAPVQVLASFALLGFRMAGGRVGAVQCCRIMPASTALSVSAAAAATAPSGGNATATAISGLGLVVRVEISSTSAGTLLLFVEGPEEYFDMDEGREELGRETVMTTPPAAAIATVTQPVRRVMSQGREPRWRYNSTGCILSVELPPAPEALAHRDVEIFL